MVVSLFIRSLKFNINKKMALQRLLTGTAKEICPVITFDFKLYAFFSSTNSALRALKYLLRLMTKPTNISAKIAPGPHGKWAKEPWFFFVLRGGGIVKGKS